MKDFFSALDFTGIMFKEKDWEKLLPEFASRANCLLKERGKLIYYDIINDVWGHHYKNRKFVGLLINVESIPEPDSAEKILQLIVGCSQHDGTYVPSEIIDRAKKLLGVKK